MKKDDLVKFLNEYLKIDNYQDSSKNWLQVDTSKQEIKKIWYAVDAASYLFDKAIEEWVDMVICHHGMFWGDEQVLTWLLYDRVKKLISNDIWLYACHLPLDWHGEVGNNIVILNKFLHYFDLDQSDYIIDQFWFYRWQSIWFALRLNSDIKYENFIEFCKFIWLDISDYNFWDRIEIKSICFVSGWWGSALFEAKDKWFDVFLTWEMSHSSIMFAKELKQTVVLWWHYETEIFGVQALSEKLNKDFGIEIVFLDEKY